MRDVDVGTWIGDHQYYIPALHVVKPRWMFACSWVRLFVNPPIGVGDTNNPEGLEQLRAHGPIELRAVVSYRRLERTNNESET